MEFQYPWAKLKVTVFGPEAGNFLAHYFADEKLRAFNGDVWIFYPNNRFPFDPGQFKIASLKYDVTVEFCAL